MTKIQPQDVHGVNPEDVVGGRAPLCYVAVAYEVSAAWVLEHPPVQKMCNYMAKEGVALGVCH